MRTQQASSEDELQSIWTQVQRMVTEFALALPTVDDAAYYATRKKVQGLKLGAIGNWFFVNDMYVEK